MNKYLLAVDKLKITVDDRTLNESVSFKLSSGDILRIKGSNGTGKTTLIRQIIGLHPSVSGNIEFGFTVKLGQTVGYFPQNWQHTLLPWLSAWGNVVLGLITQKSNERCKDLTKLAKAFFPNAIIDNNNDMSWANLNKFLSQWDVRKMSGGEQEKIVLLRTLASSPKILFLDEPFRDLDYTSTKALINYINGTICTNGSSLVYISHQEVDIKPTNVINMD